MGKSTEVYAQIGMIYLYSSQANKLPQNTKIWMILQIQEIKKAPKITFIRMYALFYEDEKQQNKKSNFKDSHICDEIVQKQKHAMNIEFWMMVALG